MDSSAIYKSLFRHYKNYEYKLCNSYVYSWESDFLGMSKAGYFLEVEVKISRNDYFRDFIKDKHRIFRDICAGKKYTIERSACRGDKVCSYITGELISQYGEYSRVSSSFHHWAYESRNAKFGVWANDYGHCAIRQRSIDVYSQATRIRFVELEKIRTPNQLYYACPTGLIKQSEIPEYAGLLYVGNGVELIKKAPYIHKIKHDLQRVLLSKFYNLWTYKQTIDSQINLQQLAASK